MKSKILFLLFSLACGLLMAIQPALASSPDPLSITATETRISFVISNEAPGYLVDHLISLGHGGETLFQVLGYLKGQSGGAIPDDFYNQVAAAPAGSEVFTATLGNYTGLVEGIEIGGDGTLYIPSMEANDYASLAGYATTPSLDGSFYFTTAQDAAYTIATHSHDYGGGYRKDYFAFTVAWREGLKLYMPLVNR